MDIVANTKTSADSDIIDALSSMDKQRTRRFRKSLGEPDLSHIPGDNGLPILGHSPWFLMDFRHWLEKQYKKHGPVFRMHLPPGRDSVFLLGPDANRLLLQNEDKLFSNYFSWGEIFIGTFTNAVLGKDFAHHKQVRKTLQMAFKRQAIEGHMELMNPMLKEGIDNWPKNRTIKALPTVKKLLLDTGAKVFLGIELGPEADRLNQAFVDILGALNDPFQLETFDFLPWPKAQRGRQTLLDFAAKNIPLRRKQEGGRDIFSQLCQAKDEDGNFMLTDQEIQDQIIFVLFAAHDTTTSALCGTLYALAAHPEWQEEVRQEMIALNKDSMEFDDYDHMPKTTMTIEEVLRLYPPITTLPRFALEDFEFKGHKIPKGTYLFGCPTFTHRMPEYWSNPKKFDPYRFSPERAEHKKDFFQYVPFGGGAHKCLGLHFAQVQSKMFLFHFLKDYKVELRTKKKGYRHNNIPMALPRDGLPIAIKKI